MKILVLNCGSSSLKYRLFALDGETSLCGGVVERIGEPDSPVRDHAQALDDVLDRHAADLSGLTAVGHRVVHGAGRFTRPTLVDEAMLTELAGLSELAPLHNSPALAGIGACRRRLPDVPQVAVFDTAFFATLPPAAYTYALPHSLTAQYELRRYGFHGTSHQYVAGEAARLLGRPLEDLRLVTCHLGNGASLAAIRAGRAVDTSMGFTPLGGVVMGTRCGDLDPAVVLHLMKREGLTPDQMADLLNRESGVRGISGRANDFRVLWEAAGAGDERARLAIEIFCHTARKFIGAYAAVLDGLDVLVFTAGLGENDPAVRGMICGGLSHLGVTLDPDRNAAPGPLPADISVAGRSLPVLVIATREELAIARLTAGAVASGGSTGA